MKMVFAILTAAAIAAETDPEKLTVATPSVTVPSVAVPQIAKLVSVPEIAVPEIVQETFVLEAQKIAGPAEVASVELLFDPSVDAAILEPADAGFALILDRVRAARSLFGDQRNLQYDPTLGIEADAWDKWIAIYRANEPFTLEPKPLPENLRIIAEVKCPAGADQTATLERNLDFYAKQGYNAVLLTFDTTEDLERLIATTDLIRTHGMKIVCAYSGPEKLRWSVFRDPDLIEKFVSRICAKSDAFLIGWRRTGSHLLIQDAPFRNHLLRAARKLNPEIAIIGEAYYGHTAHSRKAVVTYNVPANASAVLLFGVGYKGVAIELAINKMFAQVKNLPRIGLAIGEKPYYDTKYNTGRTFAENLKIKQRIERRFRSGGCAATLTIRGDGSDGIYNSKFTENLSLNYGKEETK